MDEPHDDGYWLGMKGGSLTIRLEGKRVAIDIQVESGVSTLVTFPVTDARRVATYLSRLADRAERLACEVLDAESGAA